MNKFICTTTINPPTKAYTKFAKKKGWSLIIAGDLKTPHKLYKDFDAIYLSPKYQEELYPTLSRLIGWNCVQRRNFAIIEACRRGADIIATVDDDNIPFSDWGDNLMVGKEIEVDVYKGLPCFEPLYLTNNPHLWHRGFPINLVSERWKFKVEEKVFTPTIQADLWNGDPDVDAICRLIYDPFCKFEKNFIPFSSEGCSVFNSQNTFLLREVCKDYFVFPYIGRMDDIWAAFYVTCKGNKVIYNKASVFQDRNKHDVIKDMKDEYRGYENNLKLVLSLAEDVDRIFNYLPDRSAKAFLEYKKIMKDII